MIVKKQDLIWNYLSTLLRVSSGLIVLPFILRVMPAEKVGIWTILVSITSFGTLLDFGFSASFTRNVAYIFSGIRELKIKGFEIRDGKNCDVDYKLLKEVIHAMKVYYFRMSLVLFILLSTIGTYYIHNLLKNYNGEHVEVYYAWVLLCIISSYTLFSLYFESLLLGKGLVKRTKQIVALGQIIYVVLTIIFIKSGFSLVAIVLAQGLSTIVTRCCSYYFFYTKEIKSELESVNTWDKFEVLKVILPNASKLGLTALGGFLVSRSSILIGSNFLSLQEIASYGITIQIATVIASCASIYLTTYQSKIIQLMVINDMDSIKNIYLKGEVVLFLTYLTFGFVVVTLGDNILQYLKSDTELLETKFLIYALLFSCLENNHANAGNILLASNEVPFFKASLFAGLLNIILLSIMLYFLNLGIWALVLAPGISHLYNNWKWPYEVFVLLKIKKMDIQNLLLGSKHYFYGNK